MCGIIGFIGEEENSLEVILEGLSALEYRGYDSVGVASFDKNQQLYSVKCAGRVAELQGKLEGAPAGKCGIGHTRWATHGAPSEVNSHPHGNEHIQIVHNGIIENYACLKTELTELGYSFYSDTDTEVAAKLLDYYYMKSGKPYEAICETVKRLSGSYALGIVFAEYPDTLYAARKDSPLIVGIGESENYIASDITALLKRTRNYYSLENGDIAVIHKNSIQIFSDGKEAVRAKETATWDYEAAEKGGFEHFMLKEIHEEAEAIKRTLSPRVKNMLPDFLDEQLDDEMFKKVTRLHIVACGTAMHAGLIAKSLFEEYVRLPVNVEIASEFRYNNPIIDEKDLVIIVSQSGETADSLAALRIAKQKGASTLALVNVIGSTIAKEADNVLYTWAGPEIAVASTKAYCVQTALLTLLTIHCGLLRGTISKQEAETFTHELVCDVPRAIEEVLKNKEHINSLARIIAKSEDLFFIGRGVDYYLSCEGSLKLKEISYIHSEAYAAGELKHGTISLVCEGVPVIALSTVSKLYDKTQSNIREVKARGAYVVLVTNGDYSSEYSDFVINIPEISERLAFLPCVTVLQLIAYYTSVCRNNDVDKPRNLAKSVTVE